MIVAIIVLCLVLVGFAALASWGAVGIVPVAAIIGLDVLVAWFTYKAIRFALKGDE